MSANQRHTFAFGGDGPYAIPLATALSSLLATLCGDCPVDIWILDMGLEPRAREYAEKIVTRHNSSAVQLHWHQISPAAVEGLPTEGHLTPSTYAKFLLPAALPADVETAVFLDSDLVVRRDLGPLAEIDLGDAKLGAVQDFVVETVGSSRSPVAGLSERSPEAPYFNAGVLVFNLPVWRRESMTERVLEFAMSHSSLKHADQDAFNGVVDDWHSLDLEWNVQSRIFWLSDSEATELGRKLRSTSDTLLQNARVMHYSGPTKPWDPWYRQPGARVWRAAFASSGALEGRDLWRWRAAYYPRRIVARSVLGLVRTARRSRRRVSAG